MAGTSQKQVLKRLRETPNQSKPHITPIDFEQTANTPGELSRVLRFRPKTVHGIRGGPQNPFWFALPAYESLGPTNGTGGDTETFTLSHSIVDTPNTESIVVHLDGQRYGTPDAVDYEANSFDVTDPGTGSTVHAYYISDEPAEVRIKKAVPGSTSVSQDVFTATAHRLHQADQSDGQAPSFSFGADPFEPFVAADMTLDVEVKAPYTVQFWETSDFSEADNALFNIPANEGQDTVQGLKGAIRNAMAGGE